MEEFHCVIEKEVYSSTEYTHWGSLIPLGQDSQELAPFGIRCSPLRKVGISRAGQ